MSEQYFFRVNGMSCGGCVETVESAVKNIKGVEGVEVDLETGMASVKGNVSAEQVSSAIDAEGYNAIIIPE